jgi:hypothetical protein
MKENNALQIHMQNRTMKPLAVALSGAWRESRWEDGGGNLTKVQCKPIGKCHNESPLYNEYILIKMNKKESPLFLSCLLLKIV